MSVVPFPNGSPAGMVAADDDVPAVLRQLADDTEAGKYGAGAELVVVIRSGGALNIFGAGHGVDGTAAHYLLCCAARKMELPAL